MNELTTSGTFPERSAAVILSSLIAPTTLTLTSAFLASYSATTFLNSFSSRALQPTQIVRFVAVDASLAAAEAGGADRGGEHETYESDDDRRFASHRDLLLGRSRASGVGIRSIDS